MRNTKIALAVLALVASTAAMADVSIYGALDASVGNVTGGKMNFDGTGNWQGSTFGFKGTEEVDGGMKAFFNLEMGLNIANGTQNNGGTTWSQGTGLTTTNVFNRLANVGLSGDFGTVTLGQQLNQFVAGTLSSNLNSNQSSYVGLLLMSDGNSGRSFGGGGTGVNGGFFQPNLVTYSSPSIGGFSGAVQTQIKGNSNYVAAGTGGLTAADEDSMNAASVHYSAGPVAVNAAYLNREKVSKAYSLGTTYNMGEITLNARYINFADEAVTTNPNINTWNVGAAYALSANTSVSLQFAQNNIAGADQGRFTNLGVQHNLSKNTFLYGTVTNAKNAIATYSQLADGTGANTDTSKSYTGYAIGIVKGF